MPMKALQVVRPRTLRQVEVPIPTLPAGANDSVLVRTAWVSMCGSDIPFFTGNKRTRTYPLAPGAPIHECVGRVVDSSTDLFRAGEWVLSIPDGDQGLAEFFLARAGKTVTLTSGFEDFGAACIVQPLSTVMKAVERLGEIRGKSLAVVGLGSTGLLFCWLARRSGASSVLGVDPLAGRCRMADALGATRTLCRRGIEVVHDVRSGAVEWDPPDICIEAVGHQMDTINDCVELVKKYGTVVSFGVPDHDVYALEYESFFRKNAVLMASVTPDWAQYLPRARDLFMANRNELSSLVTHRLPIRDAGRAFLLYEQHEDGILKAALDATDW